MVYDKKESMKNIVGVLKCYHHYQPEDEREIRDFSYQIIDNYLTQLSGYALPNNIGVAKKMVAEIRKKFVNQPKVLCHHDLCGNNFIFDGKKLYLADWEFADWNDLFYDLASLCVEQEYEEEEKELLLGYYFEKYSIEQRIHLEMMCMLYSMRAALWAFHQDATVGNKNFDFQALAIVRHSRCS